MLDKLKSEGRHPPIPGEMTVRDLFARLGLEEWQALETRFRRSE
jgi:hypothetical protein